MGLVFMEHFQKRISQGQDCLDFTCLSPCWYKAATIVGIDELPWKRKQVSSWAMKGWTRPARAEASSMCSYLSGLPLMGCVVTFMGWCSFASLLPQLFRTPTGLQADPGVLKQGWLFRRVPFWLGSLLTHCWDPKVPVFPRSQGCHI